MKYIFLTTAMILNVSILYSQKTSIAFQAGISFPNRYSPTVSILDNLKKVNRKLTFIPGIKYKYRILNHLQFKGGLQYEERGWYANITAIDQQTGTILEKIRTNFYYSFITFPATIQVYLGNNFKFCFGGGLNSSLRIGGSTKVHGEKVNSLELIHPEMKQPLWDISSAIELGINIKLSNKLNFLIEWSHYKSISPIGNYQPIEEKVFHKGYMILIGLENNF